MPNALEDGLFEGSVLRNVLDGISVLLQPALLTALHVLLPPHIRGGR